jgi:hypothetical protein
VPRPGERGEVLDLVLVQGGLDVDVADEVSGVSHASTIAPRGASARGPPANLWTTGTAGRSEGHIVRVNRLRTPAEIFEYEGAQDEIRDVIDAWPLPEGRRPHHASMLVLVPRPVRLRSNEAQWFLADRYLNHLRPIFTTGDCLLVTEHGWVDFMTLCAGLTPAMRAAA